MSSSSWIYGQYETVLHLNKSFYVTGEVVWMNTFLPISLQEGAAIHTMVVNREGNIQDEFFIKTEDNKTARGYYKIPFHLESDIYNIRFQVYDKATQKPIVLLDAQVPIYSDLANISPEDIHADGKIQTNAVNLTNNLTLETSFASEFARGDEIAGSVSSEEEASASLSVSDQGGAVYSQQLGEVLGDVETRIIVNGQLSDVNNNPLQVNVLGAFSREENKIFYTKSFEDGHFALALPDFKGYKTIQFMGYPKEVDQVIAKLDRRVDVPQLPEIVYNAEVIDYLEQSRLRKKIYQYFGALEYQLEEKPFQKEVQELPANFSYEFASYEPFENVGAFFRELITPLKFELQEDSTYTAYMENPTKFQKQFSLQRSTRLSGRPFFIVDGKITRDANYVANLDYNIIDKVELFFKPQELRQMFNAMGSSGVVRVMTTLPEVTLPSLDENNVYRVPGFLPEITQVDLDSNSPNLKTAIYWNDDLSLDTSRNTITFSQSDDRGTYVLTVVARTEEGKLGFTSTTYEVK